MKGGPFPRLSGATRGGKYKYLLIGTTCNPTVLLVWDLNGPLGIALDAEKLIQSTQGF